MWSEQFNGLPSAIIDYHRLNIHISNRHLKDENISKDLSSLCSFNQIHILIDLNSEDEAVIDILDGFRSSMRKELDTLYTDDVISSSIYVSVITDMSSTNLIESIVTSRNSDPLLRINFIYVRSSGHTRDGLVNALSHLELSFGKFLSFGLTLSSEDKFFLNLEYIINNTTPRFIKAVYIGTLCDLPNIKLRALDFIHSKGINTVAKLSENIFDTLKSSSQFWSNVSAKHGKHEFAVFCRCLFQFGYMLSIPIEVAISDRTFFREAVGSTCHPFADRAAFVAPTKLKHFNIAQEDLDELREISERKECEEDAWIADVLSNHVSLKLRDVIHDSVYDREQKEI